MNIYKGFHFNSLILATSVLMLTACGGGDSSSNSVIAGQKIYMSATDGVKGYELYASDATTGETALIKDINLTGSSNPEKLVEINGVVYFSADDGGVNASSLWKTDGTTAGTVFVHSVDARSGSTPIVIGDTFYFLGSTTATGMELWKSDGTTDGTVLVKDINPGVEDSSWSIVEMGGDLYLSATDNSINYELWKSDGTTEGTVLLKDINPGTTNSSYPRSLTVIGNMIYFSAYHLSYGYEIWKSDGTTAGTNILVDLNTNRFGCDGSALGSNPAMLTTIGDKLYFTANNNPNNTCRLVFNGPQVWVSDGTTTTKLIELAPPSTGGGSYPSKLTAVGNTLFFTGYTSAAGTELWKSDGTVAGTTMVKDINPGPAASDYFTLSKGLFMNVNGILYFSATDGTTGAELWKSDGSELNTVLVRDINTTSASATSSLAIGNTVSYYKSQSTSIGSTVYFTANDGIHGVELWKSDGTENGTNLVSDLNLGNADGAGRVFN